MAGDFLPSSPSTKQRAMACSPSMFTVDWSIENFDCYHSTTISKICGPHFTIEEFNCARFSLCLLPNEGSYVGFEVHRMRNCEGPDLAGPQVHGRCKLFVGTCSYHFHCLKQFDFKLSKSEHIGWSKCFERSKLQELTCNCTPRGTLMVRCEFYKPHPTLLAYGCTGVTHIGKEQVSRILRFKIVEGTSGLAPVVQDIDSKIQTSWFVMKVDLEVQHTEDIYVTIRCQKQSPRFVAIVRISWLDVEYGRHIWKQGKHFFKRHSEVWLFPHFLPKAILEEDKDKYLVDGVLFLYVTVSWGNGNFSSLVEEYHYASPSTAQGKKLDSCLYSLYKNHKFSDHVLKSNSRTYKVHKFILWARSSVFRAMLESDMAERETGVVHIDDLKGDPMSKFVRYLYCGNVEKSTDLEVVERLYWAADKYDLGALKVACSKMLANLLSLDNSLNVLVLADRHVDDVLKRTVQEFITHHLSAFLLSPQWEFFMQEPNKLGKELSQYLRSKEHRT